MSAAEASADAAHGWRAGDALGPLEIGPITRRDLAVYCGAAGDGNPIHVDIDHARAAGFDDVFAHGMLSMAYLARLLTDAVPQERIIAFDVRFKAITRVGDRVTCSGVVERIDPEAGRAEISLQACTQAGVVTLAGHAVVALAAGRPGG